MDKGTAHVEVRAVHVDGAPALYKHDYSFETDRICTLRVLDRSTLVDGNPTLVWILKPLLATDRARYDPSHIPI